MRNGPQSDTICDMPSRRVDLAALIAAAGVLAGTVEVLAGDGLADDVRADLIDRARDHCRILGDGLAWLVDRYTESWPPDDSGRSDVLAELSGLNGLSDRENLRVVLFQLGNLAASVAGSTLLIARHRDDVTAEEYTETVERAATQADQLRLRLGELATVV
jgi:hypothetical protein